MNNRFVWLGVSLGAFFWIMESAIHTVAFDEGNLLQQIYSPGIHESWMRLVVVGLFVGFGVYAQSMFIRRRQAEEATKAINVELDQIFQTAADGMRVVDKDFNVLRVNQTFAAMSGVNIEDAIGKRCYDTFWGPQCHTPDCPLTRILGGEERVEHDAEKTGSDGSKVPCIVTTTPFRGADGELIGIVEDFKDIGDRKKQEAKITRSKEEWEKTFDTVPDLIMILDNEFRILRTNKAMAEMLGTTPKDLVGLTCYETVHGTEEAPDFCPHARMLSDGLQHTAEVFEHRTERCFIVSVAPLRDDDGAMIGSVHVAHDITQRKRMEDSLRKSEEFNRRIIESSHDCIKVLDTDGQLQFMSEGGQELLEINDIEPYLGESWVDFWKDSDRVAAFEAIAKAKKGDIGSFQGFCGTVSGKPRWWDVVITPIKGAGDNVEQLLSISRDITDSKEAEERLKKSEEKYRELVKHAPSAIYEIDYINSRFLSFNEVVPAYTGYSENELKEIDPADLFTEYSKGVFYERLNLMKAGEEVSPSQEYEIRKKDGSTMWALITASYELENGKPLRARIVAHDITARKKIEAALREREKQYRTLFDGAADIIVVVDRSGNLIDMNQKFEEQSGFSREEMVGKNVFASGIIAESSSSTAILHFDGLLNGQEWTKFEIHGKTKNGTVIPYEITAVPIKRDGHTVAVQAILRDIRDRQKAEELLRTEKEKFEILVEESPLAVSLIGKNGTYKYVNPKFVEMFGYTLEDVPNGKAWFVQAYPDRAHRDEVISAWKADNKRSAVGEARPRTYRVTCKDGSEKVIHFRPVTMHNEDQLVIYEDITTRKQIEEQLRQAQKMEAIGTLAGGIAHDFNNLLTPIIVHSEIAAQFVSEGSPMQRNLEKVTEAGYRARDLVKQILAFSRQSERQRMPLNIGPIVRETLKLLRASLPTTIDIWRDIRAELDVVMADPTEIHQILLNLCTNAAHAMREKGGVLEVSLVDFEVTPENSQDRGLEPGPYVRLTVRDTGYGMDGAIIDRIFDPFFTTKGPGEGTGMGLAVVHGIVKSYDGTITVKSEPAKGSAFHIFLPTVEQEVLRQTEPAGPVPTGTERILLVDDDKSMIDAVQLMLRHLGYKVVTAVSGVEAIEIFRERPDHFDLVVTDQTMPKMTGKELSQKLLSTRPDIPIILFTGFSDQITAEEAKAIGISKFLMKPVVFRDMAMAIRQVIHERAHQNKAKEYDLEFKN